MKSFVVVDYAKDGKSMFIQKEGKNLEKVILWIAKKLQQIRPDRIDDVRIHS